jgi:hypothetical protein
MNRRIISTAIFLLGAGLASQTSIAASQEPIQPIEPAKVTNASPGRTRQEALFRPAPVEIWLHLLQFLPQPVDGGHRQHQDLDR